MVSMELKLQMVVHVHLSDAGTTAKASYIASSKFNLTKSSWSSMTVQVLTKSAQLLMFAEIVKKSKKIKQAYRTWISTWTDSY